MAFDPTFIDKWERFPGLYDAVLAALPRPEEFTIEEEKQVERDTRPHKDWPPEPQERFALVTVVVRIPLPIKQS